MGDLAREFDACGECRLDVGGPSKYKVLTQDEIERVVDALQQHAGEPDRQAYKFLYEEKCELIEELRETIQTIYSLRGEDPDIADLCNERLEDPRFV